MQRSALCRSQRELSNEHLLDEIGVDTAENELLQVLFKIIQHSSIVSSVEDLLDERKGLLATERSYAAVARRAANDDVFCSRPAVESVYVFNDLYFF